VRHYLMNMVGKQEQVNVCEQLRPAAIKLKLQSLIILSTKRIHSSPHGNQTPDFLEPRKKRNERKKRVSGG